MDEIERFFQDVRERIASQGRDADLRRASIDWIAKTLAYKHSYMYTWLGRPVIQFPADIVAMQEIIWTVRPQLVVETGVAHGGSLILHASILELIGGDAKVLGVDVEIRAHNRRAIEEHPLSKRIELIEGSSIAASTVARVRAAAEGLSPVLVVLDSNHTREHVARELELYSPLVTPGSYLVVFDTVIEDLPPDSYPDRPWGPGDNPKTAVLEFLEKSDRFEIDQLLEGKLMITAAPGGYLRCLK